VRAAPDGPVSYAIDPFTRSRHDGSNPNILHVRYGEDVLYHRSASPLYQYVNSDPFKNKLLG
jgi:hypothetical protein